MTGFKWSPRKNEAAVLFAEGYTVEEVSHKTGQSERQLYRWRADITFSTEVDRMALDVGIAKRSERLKIAQRIVRQKLLGEIPSDRDLLEWLKYSQGETDGIKQSLNLNFNYDGLFNKLFPDEAEAGTPADLEQPDAG